MACISTNIRMRRGCILHILSTLSTSWPSKWHCWKASKVGWTFDVPGVLKESLMPFFSIVWSSGIPNELVIVTKHTGMSLAEQTYKNHQHLNVCTATSHNIRRHFHGFPIISPNKHEQFWGYPATDPAGSLDPLVLPQVPAPDPRRRCWFGTNSRATSWRNCAKLARLGTSRTRHKARDGLRMVEKCWKIV